MTPQKNEIVVYQPNDIMRIEVRFEDETVWLQQPRIAELFACSLENVRLHLINPESGRVKNVRASRRMEVIGKRWRDGETHI